MSDQYSADITNKLMNKSRPFKNPKVEDDLPEDPNDLRVKLNLLLAELKAKETKKQEEEIAR